MRYHSKGSNAAAKASWMKQVELAVGVLDGSSMSRQDWINAEYLYTTRMSSTEAAQKIASSQHRK
jgi:hypothetical protein